MKRFVRKVMLLAIMMLAVCSVAWGDVAIDAVNFHDEVFVDMSLLISTGTRTEYLVMRRLLL